MLYERRSSNTQPHKHPASYVMSNSGGGSNSYNNPGHQSVKITLPNPNAHKPSSPSRSSNSGAPYPFTSNAYSSSQSKPLPNKSLPGPFPSPAHMLSQSPSPHQDPYLNSPSNFPNFQYSSSNDPRSYPSPTSSPESSPRIGARDHPYTLPALNISLPSLGNSGNQNAPPPPRNPPPSNYPSSYSNPISFVSSSPSPPPRPLKDSTGAPPAQFSSGPSSSFSPPPPRRSIPTPPPQPQSLAISSPPPSPTHDGFSQPYPRTYPSPTHPSFSPASSKYSNTYMESPSTSGQLSTPKSSNTSPNLQARAYSPHLGPAPVLPGPPQSPVTSSQAPPSPAHPSQFPPSSPKISPHSTSSQPANSQSTSPGSSHHPSVMSSPRISSVPPSPMRQAPDDDEYEEVRGLGERGKGRRQGEKLGKKGSNFICRK